MRGKINLPTCLTASKINKNQRIGKGNAKKVVPLQTKKCIECLVNLFKNKNYEQQG